MASQRGLASVVWFRDGPARVFGDRHRWVSLLLGVFVQLCVGTLYSVSAWGVSLREVAGWQSDEDLSLATTVGTLGIYLAVHNGLLLDRFGARPCLALSSVLLFTGWHLLAHVVRSKGSPGSAAFALALVGQGSVFAFIGSLAPNVANFAQADQGKAHGVLLAGFGGSAAVFASAYRSWFVQDLPGFFGFTGWVTSLVVGANALACLDGTGAGKGNAGYSQSGTRTGIGLTKLPSNSEIGEESNDAEDERVTLVGSSSGVASSSGGETASERTGGARDSPRRKLSTERDVDAEHGIAVGDTTVETETPGTPGLRRRDSKTIKGNEDGSTEDCSLFRHIRFLCTQNLFWMIYFHLVLTLGTALLWVNQAGPFAVVADTHVTSRSQELTNLVILFSAGNVLGRVFCGVASDFFEQRFGAPRSVFLIVGSVGLTLSAGALASDPGNAVTRNAVALAVGLSEGTIMAAWTSTVRSLFGEKRFGLHLAVYNSALAIGSSFFNGFAAVATKISDDATDAENAENEGYTATFAIATTACGGATLLGIAIVKATRGGAEGIAVAERRRREMDG